MIATGTMTARKKRRFMEARLAVPVCAINDADSMPIAAPYTTASSMRRRSCSGRTRSYFSCSERMQ